MTNQELKRARLKVIAETVLFYNSTNRCVQNDRCCYWAPMLPHGCAVGRLLTLKERKRLPASGVVSNDDLFNMLPSRVRQLGQWFLMALQSLHDTGSDWSRNGLTEDGLKQLEIIYKNHINPLMFKS